MLRTSLTLLLTSTILACAPLQFDTQLNNENIDVVVAELSIAEKVNLVLGTGMDTGPESNGPAVGIVLDNRVPGAAGTTFPVPQHEIPSMVLADGPAGVRISPIRKGVDDQTFYGTAFPIASLLASSWDTELIEQVGIAIGKEAREYGVDIILGPALNIHRHALGGRNFEYFSEDPLVSGKMAAAIVNGIQAQGVGTSLKHYVANNHEWNRNTMDVQLSERALREIYLKGFEIAVKESQPWTIMSSYNKVNGEYASESRLLLTDVLRTEWGFDGLVMTDWFGGSDVVKQMNAGNDLLMPGAGYQKAALLAALEAGELDEDILDINVTNILNVVSRSQVFANYKYSGKPDLASNAEVARRAAAESMVLLKNNVQALPLKPGAKLAVFGNFSYDMVTGGTGSGDVNEAYVVSLQFGLTDAGFMVSDLLHEQYQIHIAEEKAKIPASDFPLAEYMPKDLLPELELTDEQIQQLVESTDIGLLTIGRNSGEFVDRKTQYFYLNDREKALIEQVSSAYREAGKPVVAIMNVGGVIETANWHNKFDAILLAYQPGQEAGHAISDVLAGAVNPSGKLIDTFPFDMTDYPSHAGFPGRITDEDYVPNDPMRSMPSEVIYEEGIYNGYRFFNSEKKKVVYPFGYGLSYTQFEYGDVKLSGNIADGEITASVTITNTGDVAGKEVVQLYLSAPDVILDKPSEELRAFDKTQLLAPGQSETIHFRLTARDLTSFDETHRNWLAEAGTYQVKIGASSRDFKTKASFELDTEIRVQR